MREIKFRCWHKSTKDMIYPDRLRELTMNMMSEDDEDVLMQYTGLKDKNSKEVFEGDIVENIFTKERAVIEWKNEERYVGFSLEIFQEEYGLNEIEIIGNKFENPELLKEKNK